MEEGLEQRERANIVEGYRLFDNDGSDELQQIPFSFYAEINVDNSRLWELLTRLSKELPDMASLIFGLEGGELSYSDYLSKSGLMADLVEFKREIAQDTFIEIGLIFSDETKLVEVLVADSKYIKFWGVDKDSFRQIMSEFSIEENEEIAFADEYPNVREHLTKFYEDALPTDELIERLEAKYRST